MIYTTPPPISSPGWSTRTKWIVSLIVLLLVGILLWQIAEVLPVVIVSSILAFLFNPLTTALERNVFRRLPGSRIWAILVTFLIVLFLFILLILVVIPVMFNQFRDFAVDLPATFERLQGDLEVFLSQPISFSGSPFLIDNQPVIPLDYLREFMGAQPGQTLELFQSFDLIGTVRGTLSSLAGPAFSVVGGAFTSIINIVFLLTLMFYMLKDGNRFPSALVSVTPETYKNDVRRLLYELAQVWNAYLRGQIILCIVIGVFVLFAGMILGVPNAPMLALLAGVLEFIPNLGPFLALVPAALFALFSESSTLPFLSGPTFALVVIVVWTLIQNIESVVIVPRVMGDSLNLHPIVVLVGVIAGANLAGILGVLLAAPVIATFRMFAIYIYGKLTDRDPFPPPKRRAQRGVLETARLQVARRLRALR